MSRANIVRSNDERQSNRFGSVWTRFWIECVKMSTERARGDEFSLRRRRDEQTRKREREREREKIDKHKHAHTTHTQLIKL